MLRRRVPLRALRAFLLVLIGALPFFAYDFLVFNFDAFWSVAYGKQNVLVSPSPVSLVAGFGGIVALAVVGLLAFLRGFPMERLLVLVALVLGLLLMYSPVEYQRRFAFGLQPLIAEIAAVGAFIIWQRLNEWHWSTMKVRRLVVVLLLGYLLFATNATFTKSW